MKMILFAICTIFNYAGMYIRFIVNSINVSVRPSIKHETLNQCDLMLALRLQRCANIKSTLAQRLVFVGE